MTVSAMIRLDRALMLGLFLLALPRAVHAQPLDWGPVVVPVPVVVGGPPPVAGWVVPPYTDVRTGRCLAGFARDAFGACRRLDAPTLVCPPGGVASEACAVLAPNPQPYGPGAALRMNY